MEKNSENRQLRTMEVLLFSANYIILLPALSAADDARLGGWSNR